MYSFSSSLFFVLIDIDNVEVWTRCGHVQCTHTWIDVTSAIRCECYGSAHLRIAATSFGLCLLLRFPSKRYHLSLSIHVIDGSCCYAVWWWRNHWINFGRAPPQHSWQIEIEWRLKIFFLLFACSFAMWTTLTDPTIRDCIIFRAFEWLFKCCEPTIDERAYIVRYENGWTFRSSTRIQQCSCIYLAKQAWTAPCIRHDTLYWIFLRSLVVAQMLVNYKYRICYSLAALVHWCNMTVDWKRVRNEYLLTRNKWYSVWVFFFSPWIHEFMDRKKVYVAQQKRIQDFKWNCFIE